MASVLILFLDQELRFRYINALGEVGAIRNFGPMVNAMYNSLGKLIIVPLFTYCIYWVMKNFPSFYKTLYNSTVEGVDQT